MPWPPLAPIEERFWSRVRRGATDECWLWIGPVTTHGYGRFSKGGRRSGVAAHRMSYELTRGPIPDGLFVCHRCDNPPCVNPSHLRLGTQTDNMQDMMAKGRRTCVRFPGKENGRARLSEADVRKIRTAFVAGISQAHLASAFGVGKSNIEHIVKGRVWTHLLGTKGSPTLAELQAAPKAKSGRRLTAETVAAIRQGAAAGISGNELARIHGCSGAVASDIITRRSWRHLP